MTVQPFQKNDIVFIKPGLRSDQPRQARVIKCQEGACWSGWLVTVAKIKKGRPAKNPSIWLKDIDSWWFTKKEPNS